MADITNSTGSPAAWHEVLLKLTTDEDTVAWLRAGIKNEEPVTVELRNYRNDDGRIW